MKSLIIIFLAIAICSPLTAMAGAGVRTVTCNGGKPQITDTYEAEIIRGFTIDPTLIGQQNVEQIVNAVFERMAAFDPGATKVLRRASADLVADYTAYRDAGQLRGKVSTFLDDNATDEVEALDIVVPGNCQSAQLIRYQPAQFDEDRLYNYSRKILDQMEPIQIGLAIVHESIIAGMLSYDEPWLSPHIGVDRMAYETRFLTSWLATPRFTDQTMTDFFVRMELMSAVRGCILEYNGSEYSRDSIHSARDGRLIFRRVVESGADNIRATAVPYLEFANDHSAPKPLVGAASIHMRLNADQFVALGFPKNNLFRRTGKYVVYGFDSSATRKTWDPQTNMIRIEGLIMTLYWDNGVTRGFDSSLTGDFEIHGNEVKVTRLTILNPENARWTH